MGAISLTSSLSLSSIEHRVFDLRRREKPSFYLPTYLPACLPAARQPNISQTRSVQLCLEKPTDNFRHASISLIITMIEALYTVFEITIIAIIFT